MCDINKYFSIIITGLLFALFVQAQTNKIRIGTLDNSDGRYNQCGTRLHFQDAPKLPMIFASVDDETTMKINGKVEKFELVDSTEGDNSKETPGETFSVSYKSGKYAVFINYIVDGFSDNTVRYKGILKVTKGNTSTETRIVGSAGC